MDDPSTAARKQELRATLRARRAHEYGGTDGAARRDRESLQLLEHAAPLIEHVLAAQGSGGVPVRVAAYHPTPTEADVLPLARRLAELGAELVFPAAAGTELEWILWDGSSPFVPSPGRGFGKEPSGPRLGPDALAQVSLALVPAVAVDRSGTRIGHGAGYYDRALTSRAVTTELVAVVHPSELLEAGSLPRGAHDVPIPAVLTAAGLVSLVTIDGAAAPGSPRQS